MINANFKMANPKSEEARQAYIETHPFEGFIVSDDSILDELKGRHPCPQCGKSRKFYCYTCYVPIALLEKRLPKVKLPIKIDIIKHKNEIDGKSTSGHAAVLASEDVRVFTYPDIPDYADERVVLIYPSFKAIRISQLISVTSYDEIKHLENQLEELPTGVHRSTLLKVMPEGNQEINGGNKKLPITRAIFIDSTWNQSKGIYKDDRLNKIPCVVIENRISQFWRHQKGSPRWYLATIEAIHQFLIEIHMHCWGLDPNYEGIFNCFLENDLRHINKFYSSSYASYSGQYDNLLYFFKNMYKLIHEFYNHDDLYAYTRPLK